MNTKRAKMVYPKVRDLVRIHSRYEGHPILGEWMHLSIQWEERYESHPNPIKWTERKVFELAERYHDYYESMTKDEGHDGFLYESIEEEIGVAMNTVLIEACIWADMHERYEETYSDEVLERLNA